MDVSYASAVPGAAALEEEVRAARARHRARLDALAALSDEQAALERAMAPGEPATVAERLRELLGRIPLLAPLVAEPSDAGRLEERVERAQRRVLEIAHHLDRLAADRAQLAREVASLEARISDYEADAQRAADAIVALEQAQDEALEAGRDGLAIEARLGQREGELRAFQRGARRLGAIRQLHQGFLRLDERLTERLSRLHEAGADALDALDAQLTGLAAEERAAELARVVGDELGDLEAAVARVNRLAGEGAVWLTADVDRLADQLDLLAPLDAEALAAEREVSVHLRNRSVADAVARARQQASLRDRRSEDDP